MIRGPPKILMSEAATEVPSFKITPKGSYGRGTAAAVSRIARSIPVNRLSATDQRAVSTWFDNDSVPESTAA